MPYVRQQPGQKPGDQQREQVEQTSGLQRESGLIGSTGGSLHEGMQRPVSQAAKPVPTRALNLSDYAAANVSKTRNLAQSQSDIIRNRDRGNIGQIATTPQGRSGLLQQRYAPQGGYTTGAGILDTALLGGQSNLLQESIQEQKRKQRLRALQQLSRGTGV